MSELTLRQATEKDWPALIKMGADIRHLKSDGVYACLCYEKNTLVGAATGTADVAPRLPGADETRTARLNWVHSKVPNRNDILWVLVEWLNALAIRLGHTQSEVAVPYDPTEQCTNVLPTEELVATVEQNFGVTTRTEGFDNAAKRPVRERLITEDLMVVRDQYAAWLDKLGCKRVWQ